MGMISMPFTGAVPTDACTSLVEGSCPVAVGEVLTHQLQIEVRDYTLYRHL